jgi:hypothetical protein
MDEKSPSLQAYRAALIDYLLGSGESGLTVAYELGRRGLGEGSGITHIAHVHSEAVTTIIESAVDETEVRRRLDASAQFLVEALSPYELVSRR